MKTELPALEQTQRITDRLAIGASALCALHCVLTPLLLGLFPTAIALPMDAHDFHLLLVWIVIPLSLIAAFIGCSRHKDPLVLSGVVLGLVTLCLAAFLGCDVLGELGEKVATVLGSLLLAGAHYRNFVLCRAAACEDPSSV